MNEAEIERMLEALRLAIEPADMPNAPPACSEESSGIYPWCAKAPSHGPEAPIIIAVDRCFSCWPDARKTVSLLHR
jgi:hypothetical protein